MSTDTDPQAEANAAADPCQARHPYLGGLESVGADVTCELRAGHTGDHRFTTNPGTPQAYRHVWSDRATPDAVPVAPPVAPD